MHRKLIKHQILFTIAAVSMIGLPTAHAAKPRTPTWRMPLNAQALSGHVRLGGLKVQLVVPGRSLSFTDSGNSWSVDQRGQGTLRRGEGDQLLYVAPDRAQYSFGPAKVGTEEMTQSDFGGQAAYYVATHARFSGGETWRWIYDSREVRENCESKGRFGLTNPDCRIHYFQRPDAIVSNRGLMLKPVYASATPGVDFNRLVELTLHDNSRCGADEACLSRAPIVKRVKVTGTTALIR